MEPNSINSTNKTHSTNLFGAVHCLDLPLAATIVFSTKEGAFSVDIAGSAIGRLLLLRRRRRTDSLFFRFFVAVISRSLTAVPYLSAPTPSRSVQFQRISPLFQTAPL